MQRLRFALVLLPFVILSEAKDLSKVEASRIVICVTNAPIVRFLAPVGMTRL